VPSVVVPSFVKPLGQGGPGGTPTFVLAIISTTAKFARTAEFHGFEDFRLGWDPPCVVVSDPTQEPRTFYAREPAKGEPSLVEESGGPVFVDISSGCGSNKGSGWSFSLYLTARDTRTPHDIALYMLNHMQSALSTYSASITSPTVATELGNQVTAALATLDTNAAGSVTNMGNFISIADANPAAFTNTSRNVSGELVGRGMSARYMLLKLISSGSIVEFPVPTSGSNPYGIAAGPDGNLWFTEQLGNKIGRITTTGNITEFAVPTAGSEPVAITAGPDGNMWFVESGNVGRITPAGVITEFPVPGASLLYEIATGADGNLWLADRAGGPPYPIRRITPSGTITAFPSPVSSAGMTAGPDGNVWFTAYAEGQIGRITPAGVVTVFPIPTANSSPNDITQGPDGNLWFTEQATNNIGRITPAGVVTEFPIPPPASSTYGIKTGADGNLWFAALSGHIGRITPAGVITVFTATPGSEPHMTAAGSDGNVWFTERAGNRIGRITP
jgi:streptogramin lyase